MNRGFMGSDVFGGRAGRQVAIVRPMGAVQSQGPALSGIRRPSMGQSRTEGIEFEPSAPNLCSLLRAALAASPRAPAGREWDDFLSALDRLRPPEKENAKWRADAYNQMAMHCPDDVALLRSVPGIPPPEEKCVRVTVKKTPNQDVSTLIAPFQARGWSVVEVPRRAGPRPLPAQKPGPARLIPELIKQVQVSEVWACPPGQELPKKTSLTAQETADLAKSLDQATGPVRSGNPTAAACVKGAKVDLAVVERLLDRLHKAASSGEGADITQDEVDAAKKVVDCASNLGATVAPIPAPLATSGISTGAAVGIVGGAGALAFLVL